MSSRGEVSPRTLRTLQIASHREVKRGGAVQMVRLAVGLKRRGHSVACVFNRPATSIADLDVPELAENDIEVVGFDLSTWREMVRFRRFCRETDFEILHAHRDEALCFVWQATLGMKRPLIVAGRGTAYALKRPSWARFCLRSRKVKRVIAVAQAVKDVLIRCGVAADKVEVVYGGVDESEFRPGLDGGQIRNEWGVGEQTPLVGNVAALVGKKGHDVFFRAAAKVRDRVPDCRFVCVGAGRPQKFAELISELDLEDAVLFAGHRSDMPRVMAALDVVVSSSTKGEGMNGAIREAMACGLPVVATDVAGNGELVRDDVNGRLVAPRDPQVLADAIVSLLQDREQAQRFGKVARATVLERFTDSVRCERVEGIYQSMVVGELS